MVADDTCMIFIGSDLVSRIAGGGVVTIRKRRSPSSVQSHHKMLDLGRLNARKGVAWLNILSFCRPKSVILTLILRCEIRLSLRRFNVDFLGCETIGEN